MTTDQNYAARFEAMHRTTGVGGSRSRGKQIIVVHRELDRQCETLVAKHRSDTRISTSEIRRQQQSLHQRLGRIDRDRDRCSREVKRVNSYLTDTTRQHLQAEHDAAVTSERLFGLTSGVHGHDVDSRTMSLEVRRQTAEEKKAEGAAVMRYVERLVAPPETKKRIMDDVISMYGDYWD